MTTGKVNQPTSYTDAARFWSDRGFRVSSPGLEAGQGRRLKFKEQKNSDNPAFARFRPSGFGALRRVRHSRGSGDGGEYPAEGIRLNTK